jgi:hypothetical protein
MPERPLAKVQQLWVKAKSAPGGTNNRADMGASIFYNQESTLSLSI